MKKEMLQQDSGEKTAAFTRPTQPASYRAVIARFGSVQSFKRPSMAAHEAGHRSIQHSEPPLHQLLKREEDSVPYSRCFIKSGHG
jgi:hypothetical protein